MSEETTLGELNEIGGEGRWRESKLEDLLTEMLTGGRPTGGGLDKGEYISIGGTQVDSEGYLDFQDLVYIPEDYFEQVEETQLQKHDILVVKDGANTGDVAIAWKGDDRVVTNEHLFTLRVDSSINPPYLFYFLLSHRGWKQIHGTITGSAQEGINRGFASKVDVEYPALEEQRKIASVLYNIDRLIQKTEGIVEQIKQLKKGISQQLFHEGLYEHKTESRQLLGDVPKDWDISTIGELCHKVTDGTHKAVPAQETGEPCLTAKNIRDWGFNLKDMKYISKGEHEEILSRCHPEKGDLLYVKDGANTGMVQVNTLDFEFSLLNSVILMKVDKSKIDPHFLEQILSWEKMKRLIVARRTGTGIRRVTITNMEKSKILVPPINEQKEIAEVLTEFDDSIVTEMELKRQLQRVKEGLMQDLLSGGIRTTDLDIEVPNQILQHG